MKIRQAVEPDLDAMWAIFQSVIATRDTLPFADSLDRATFRTHWFGSQPSWVAEDDHGLLGMYRAGANYPDLGSHVASATYLVHPAAQGRGIGRSLVEHSLAQARSAGFLAMQFNYVVSTNSVAVRLYEKLGFRIAGTLPRAFRHGRLGLVDVYVMHRFL
ncbi:MAG TPA: GNAT family N-acetyltransferase [Longimicrobiales bacterium]|nr:GNAT family N-acetyltransferase [Longimicrobiales bacterium]